LSDQQPGPLTEPEFRRIEEAKYLIEEKASLYRPIVRLLYEAFEYGDGWVWPRDIARQIRARHPDGAEYAEEECRRDLEQLREWRVVVSEQYIADARTLEDFLNADRRYQISDRARLIEQMVEKLEGEAGPQGSLDPGRLQKLWQALVELDHLLGGRSASALDRDALAALESAWNAAADLREKIRDDANRYLREVDQDDAPEEGDPGVLLAYKKLVRGYIDDFLIDLKDFRVRAADLFQLWQSAAVDAELLAALVRNARERKADLRPEPELRRHFRAQLGSLIEFASTAGTAKILEHKTVARLLALQARIERIVLERRSFVDRKRDLERLAHAFRHAPSDAFAHELAATTFGWGTPRHMTSFLLGEEELRAGESPWLQPPWTVELHYLRRGNRQFQAITPVRQEHVDRLRLLRERAAEAQRDRELLDRLFAKGDLVLDDLAVEDDRALNRIVRLIRDCLRQRGHRVGLPDGSSVRLHLPDDPAAAGQIRAPGGVFHVRPYRLVREAGAGVRAETPEGNGTLEQ
jgi:uncharacterized protein (TIGR02677 family)